MAGLQRGGAAERERLTATGVRALNEFRSTASLDALDEAVTAFLGAAEVTAPGGPERAGSLSDLGACLFSLGTCLENRFGHAGSAADLDAAVAAGYQAVNAAPRGTPGHRRLPFRPSDLFAPEIGTHARSG